MTGVQTCALPISDSMIIYKEYQNIDSYPWVKGEIMPNGDGISFQTNSRNKPHSGSTCLKIRYVSDLNPHVGVSWFPREFNNDRDTFRGFNLYERFHTTSQNIRNIFIRFFAKGNLGQEVIICTVGGNANHEESIDPSVRKIIRLDTIWRPYTITLPRRDLSNLITGFAIYISRADNFGRNEVCVFLDDIVLKIDMRD